MTDWNQVPEIFVTEHPLKMPATRRRQYREQLQTQFAGLVQTLRSQLTESNYPGASQTLGRMCILLKTESNMPGRSWIPDSILEVANILVQWGRHCRPPVKHLSLSESDMLLSAMAGLFPYYRYHVRCNISLPFHQMVLLRAINILKGNVTEAEWLLHTIENLESPVHPGHFLTGTWKEFRYVPDQVRNHSINHSISVTKGDLPAAAEHLEFSYRNIRSYITFRQVHRLGNFVHERSTEDREFEKGVRILLETLVDKGHIFEMIFDLPAFLVLHRNLPFSSQDLEEALDIRTSTAKKYLTICEGIGMLHRVQGKSRKTHYLPNEEQILTAAAEG